MLRDTRFAGVARESLLIGGWVAMWRPLEVFLYDWWPIRAEAKSLRSIERDDRANRAIALLVTSGARLLLLVRRPQLNRLEIVYE